MQRIRIKYLEFGSYIEICGMIGLIFRFLAMLITLVVGFLNLIEPGLESVGFMLLLIIAVPLIYYILGILVGTITYLPYKTIMKYKGGMMIKYFEI